MPLWALVSSVLVTFPHDCPQPHPLQFPLGALALLRSMGTGWLFHDFGAVVELKGVCPNPCHGHGFWVLWKHCPLGCQVFGKLVCRAFPCGHLYSALMMHWEAVMLIAFSFIWS